MNNGAFGENFPYSNFHDLNMDWIVKIAKDFLDQYTNIQQTITDGLEDLDTKAQELENLLQQWYDTHSEDIASQLANATAELDTYIRNSLVTFTQDATQKANEAIASIPSDYTEFYNKAYKFGGTYFNTDTPPFTDMNNAEPNTVYMFRSLATPITNMPPITGDIFIITSKIGTVWAYQKVYNARSPMKGFFRFNTFGSWEDWIAFDDAIKFGGTIFNTDPLPFSDADSAPANVEYEFWGSTTTPSHMPVTALPGYPILFKTYAIGNTWAYQLYTRADSPNTGFYRHKIQGTWETTWHPLVDDPDHNIIVWKNGTGTTANFTSLAKAIRSVYASGLYNVTIRVYEGTYDMIEEFTELATENSKTLEEFLQDYEGLPIGHGMHLIFSPKAYVKFIYTGTNYWIRAGFSVFDTQDGDVTVEGLDINCENIKYCVHDDLGWNTFTPYTNKFLNCKMVIIKRLGNTLSANKCIGGGFGSEGRIIIDGGTYYAYSEPDGPNAITKGITYHNSPNANAKSYIIIKNIYCRLRTTVGVTWYGESTANSTAIITNCSVFNDLIFEAETPDAPHQNIELLAWNNEKRT